MKHMLARDIIENSTVSIDHILYQTPAHAAAHYCVPVSEILHAVECGFFKNRYYVTSAALDYTVNYILLSNNYSGKTHIIVTEDLEEALHDLRYLPEAFDREMVIPGERFTDVLKTEGIDAFTVRVYQFIVQGHDYSAHKQWEALGIATDPYEESGQQRYHRREVDPR